MLRKQPWKNSSSEEYISHHMSSHYRRILNAKKIVDTGPPQSYKAKLAIRTTSNTNGRDNQLQNKNVSPAVTERSMSTNSYRASSWGAESVVNSSRFHSNCVPEDLRTTYRRKGTVVDMDLINHIVYDTKNPPAVYCDAKWSITKAKESPKKRNLNVGVKTEKPKTAVATPKKSSMKNPSDLNQTLISIQRKSSKVMSKQAKSCSSFGFKSRPKKNEAVSKLRSLRVYYPPRRKKKRDENRHPTGITHAVHDKRLEICICSSNAPEVKKATVGGKEQTSSRDSAYNGGVSSLPESRSPTPDHRTVMLCACEGRRENKPRSYYDEEETKNEEKPQSVTDMPSVEPKSEEDEFKKMKEDALYVQFVQDITSEILEKGLFTNKALKKVMRKHMINNLDSLNKDRMVKEVENLRIQLGVPEDKNFLDLGEKGDDSFSIISKVYPVISDSAFTLCENSKDENQTENKLDIHTDTRSVSEIFGSKGGGSESDLDTDDAADEITEINVSKKLRERKLVVDSSSEEIIGKHKKRQKVRRNPKLKHNTPKSITSSSSDSDRSNLKYVNGPKRKETDLNKFWKAQSTSKGKHSKANHPMENKQIKLIVYTQDCQKVDQKSKSKKSNRLTPRLGPD